MPVTKVKISDFRNISSLEFIPSEGFNLFVGENAQGKTNIIEAVRLCLNGVSHREATYSDFVMQGKSVSKVELINEISEGISDEIVLNLKNEAPFKSVIVNGEKIKTKAELNKLYKTIFFGPDDLSLIKGSPALRRSYLNECISALSATYASELNSYTKALKLKNMLLKTYTQSDETLLDAYDEALAQYGSKIAAYRIKFLKSISPHVVLLHSYICGERDELSLTYMGNIFSDGFSPDINRMFTEQLKKNRLVDIRAKTSLTGTHRDDIAVLLNGENARTRASQGQQKSIALCLKLAMIELYRETSSQTPSVFLDDVMSELDTKRRNRVLRSLIGTQCFITSTVNDFTLTELNHKVFNVQSGAIICE